MNKATADRIENVMQKVERDITAEALTVKINRLISQRNAMQKLINVLDEQRIRLEKPHLKGEQQHDS